MVRFNALAILFWLTAGVVPLLAQDSIVPWFDEDENKLHRWSDDPICQTEKTIGLVTEVNFLSHYALGAAIAYGSFEQGEGFTGGHGFTLGADYIPQQKLLAPYAEGWVSANAFLFGLYYGARTLFYMDESVTRFALRPELGYGFGKFNLYYGRNIFFNKSYSGISRNTLTFSVYFSVFPFW